MAQNITVAGASYSDVPAVVLPKTGGGSATFTDVSDTTAAASDVASGKYFYDSTGTKTAGTSTGGGGGVDMPTITVTWNDDWDTIVSVVCDKTFSECETYCNNGINNCVLIQKDQSQTWAGQEIATWYDQASGTSADYIVWTAMNGTFPEFDIRYNYDNTFTTTVPSVQQITMNITTNGTHYPSGGIVQEVNVNVPTGTARSSSDLTANNLTVTAPAGLYASAASKTLTDANLVAGNIKKDVSICGLTGSYEGSGGIQYKKGTYTPSTNYTTAGNREITTLANIGFTPRKFIFYPSHRTDVSGISAELIYTLYDACVVSNIGYDIRISCRYSNTSNTIGRDCVASSWTTQTNYYLYKDSTSVYFRTGTNYHLHSGVEYTWEAFR